MFLLLLYYIYYIHYSYIHLGKGILNYNMQTLQTSRENEEARQAALKFATPEELEIVHEQHRKDFQMGQDLNLLENSNDISNLAVCILDVVFRGQRSVQNLTP